ncbi:MAG: hypothetical protein LBK99_27535 [Opitutaceae bacterium]|jgi:hypothetical protein|nr:hypothetical protein [Opitutaceae bacterium]
MQLYVTNSNSLGATGAGNETIVHDSGNNYPQLHIANSLTTAEDITLRLHSSGGAAGSTIASNLLYNDSGANTQLDGTLTLARTTSGGADRIYAYGIQVGANSTLTLGNITGTLHSGAYTGAQASGNYADPNRLQFRLTAANATAIVSGVISDGDIGTGGLSVYTASNSTAGSQLTLAGKNTYTGNTVITIGNFTLASTGALAFDVEKGNQLQLTTTGDVTLDGEFNVDFGALLPTDDTTVTLVSVTGSAVAPNYGETFALNIQSSTSETIVLTFANNYQATNLSGNWEYSLATGSLSFVAGAAIPEPAIMAALLGLATLVVAACLRQHARQPPVIHASPAPPK